MSEPDEPRPSEVELAILQVLWERGPSTVRAVHERVGKARNTGYTTVLKLMQIMAAKGMVERDESQRSHVYRAGIERARTQRRLVADLLDRGVPGLRTRPGHAGFVDPTGFAGRHRGDPFAPGRTREGGGDR